MIKYHCPGCQQKPGVPDDYAGKRMRCNNCNPTVSASILAGVFGRTDTINITMGFFSLVFLLYSTCFAQSSERYNCSDGYFSFIPPENWRVLATKDMLGSFKNRINRYEQDMESCPLSGCLMAICESKTAGGGPELPFIFIYRSYLTEESEIEIEKDWLSSESKIKDYLLSERKQQKKQKQRYSQYSSDTDVTANMKIYDARYSYQQNIHTAFEEARGQLNNVDFVRVTATILGSRTKITLFFQSPNNKNVDGNKLIRQIAESFKYNSGYEFGAPKSERMDSHARAIKRAKTSLVSLAIFSLVVLGGLFFFCLVSGVHIPVIGMVVAVASGGIVFQIMSWLVWQVRFMYEYEWSGTLPFTAAIIVMAPILWKWPGSEESEISFLKSAVVIGSLFFLASSLVFILMAVANGGWGYLSFFVFQLAFIIFIWRLDF